jgi:Astacin (Peptidase family M12A)
MALTRRSLSIGLCVCGFSGSIVGRNSRADAPKLAFCAVPDDDPIALPRQDTRPLSRNPDDMTGSQPTRPLTGSDKLPTLTPFGLGRVEDRWQKRDGRTHNGNWVSIGIAFLDGSAEQQETVRRHAQDWITNGFENLVRFEWNVPGEKAQIRVSFTRGDLNWSYIGKKASLVTSDQETMNLHEIQPYIIRHEFGHALGLRHEHQHPDLVIDWNTKKVFEDLALQHWTVEMVNKNIFDRMPRDMVCVEDDKTPNVGSIMGYLIPEGWASNFSMYPSMEITKRDRDCIMAIYRARR